MLLFRVFTFDGRRSRKERMIFFQTLFRVGCLITVKELQSIVMVLRLLGWQIAHDSLCLFRYFNQYHLMFWEHIGHPLSNFVTWLVAKVHYSYIDKKMISRKKISFSKNTTFLKIQQFLNPLNTYEHTKITTKHSLPRGTALERFVARLKGV